MLFCNETDTEKFIGHESEPTSDRSLIARKFGESTHGGMHMTAIKSRAGAPSSHPKNWETIDWDSATRQVRRLQMRIAKAFREKKHGKVKSLQWILTHSFYAKALAVKRVVQNKGGKTPGVDNKLWRTPRQRWQAIFTLKRRGYQPQPLRRIYIAKKQKGKLRPLSIPTLLCRAQQALHLLALEPVAEMQADKNAYGFRPLRSTADAIEQCFNILVKPTAAQYILEGDLEACFDTISHSWLLNHVTMDKQILKKWLTAGYVEKGKLHTVEKGTPQGSLISPTLLTITLAGLEEVVAQAAPHPLDRVHLCTYADDFIVTGATASVLETRVKPAIESFLRERGLRLSPEKTRITHIDKGFDFLGMTLRKYNGKLLITPAKSSVKKYLDNIRALITTNYTAKTENLLYQLNPKIRGWSNYYRHVCSKQTFSDVDHYIFQALSKWCKRRHSSKPLAWIREKYYRVDKGRNWVFSTQIKNKRGNPVHLDLISASQTPITRHTKVIAKATPYDPIYQTYFDKRNTRQKKENPQKVLNASSWLSCWELLVIIRKAGSPKAAL
jgi:RNA-directed DNA polymerase